MRKVYLKRYDLERNAIGRVNFDLDDRKRELLAVRYNNRKSGEMQSAIEKLTDGYSDWTRGQPVVKVNPTGDEQAGRKAYQDQLTQWRKALDGVLDAWEKDTAGLGLNDDQKKALKEARKIQERRGDLHAMNYAMLRYEVDYLRAREKQVTLKLRTLKGVVASEPLAGVVRGFKPNEIGFTGKLGVYFERVGEFLTADPRESNTEGGIFMVILGTLVMTMVMCILVVPIGVIAALYLREYAKQGPIVAMVRIAVNNLAGVPSIVFGMFGFGLFCFVVGRSIDQIFFPELGSTPTFGGGGILWASLTLALLTVPVVVVATEEALIAVPSSQREASLACGASRFQTIWNVILPQAMPGILTGTILAMARGAGEVAPLMLVGVVKYAPYAPVDGVPPFLHLERKFMHLGFHIYDLGFQSPDAEKTKPLVFSTTLVLIVLVALLNVFAIRIRNKIRGRLQSSHV
ncbi:MAG: phosphate ABC transporter permease PstA [Planctomycetes bacterium]|nr:phosphate ABC transporter permease PstA [Planctomycetota bacterium]